MASGGREDPLGFRNILENGTAVPNRVFVGGITENTNECDLKNLFSKFGNVKATKIILDKAGISRGYGFVTFETEEEAQKILKEVKCVTLNGRSLNINPAVKKQPYSRALESNAVHNSSLVWPAQPYAGAPGFSRESVYYPQGTWPFMWPQQMYLQQQCHYAQAAAQAGYPQYLYSVAPADYQYPTAGAVNGSDYSESSAESGEVRTDASTTYEEESQNSRIQVFSRRPEPNHSGVQNASHKSQSSKKNRSKATPVSEYDRNQRNPKLTSTPQREPTTPLIPHPVFAKTANGGIALMAYPGFVMGSPALVHVRDDQENVVTELTGFLHSPGALTPPPTPLQQQQCDFGETMRN